MMIDAINMQEVAHFKSKSMEVLDTDLRSRVRQTILTLETEKRRVNLQAEREFTSHELQITQNREQALISMVHAFKQQKIHIDFSAQEQILEVERSTCNLSAAAKFARIQKDFLDLKAVWDQSEQPQPHFEFVGPLPGVVASLAADAARQEAQQAFERQQKSQIRQDVSPSNASIARSPMNALTGRSPINMTIPTCQSIAHTIAQNSPQHLTQTIAQNFGASPTNAVTNRSSCESEPAVSAIQDNEINASDK